MDAGARDSLADVISKSLVKLATQPEGKVITVVEKYVLSFWFNLVACIDQMDIPRKIIGKCGCYVPFSPHFGSRILPKIFAISGGGP